VGGLAVLALIAALALFLLKRKRDGGKGGDDMGIKAPPGEPQRPARLAGVTPFG
jgi:hypothetical protein